MPSLLKIDVAVALWTQNSNCSSRTLFGSTLLVHLTSFCNLEFLYALQSKGNFYETAISFCKIDSDNLLREEPIEAGLKQMLRVSFLICYLLLSLA